MTFLKIRFINLVRLSLYRYLDSKITKTNNDFCNYIKESVGKESIGLTKKESEKILKHFEKEIFPLNKDIINWLMINLRKDEINFKTKLKEITKICKTNY